MNTLVKSVYSPFAGVYGNALFKVHRCNICTHDHRAPVQYMTAVRYRGHKVSITEDGGTFDVMIDNDLGTVMKDLREKTLIDYVEEMTR